MRDRRLKGVNDHWGTLKKNILKSAKNTNIAYKRGRTPKQNMDENGRKLYTQKKEEKYTGSDRELIRKETQKACKKW